MDADALFNSLLIHEGLRLKPYVDTTGHVTIGIGRNLTDDGITEDEARMLCTNDIARVVDTLDAEIPWWRGLNEIRQNVLAEMTYNLGWGGLSGFRHFLECCEAQAFERAATEMLQSRWATQVGQARSVGLAHMMRTGMPV